MTLSTTTKTEIEKQRDRYPHPRSAVLPSLWAVQHEFGHLPVEGMREVADLLGLAPSEVQAVATFYSMYFTKPAGDHSVIVCTNVSCALRGSDDIVSHIEKSLGCASGETSADGAFTWEATVECLGACGGAPAMQVDHLTYENLTPAETDRVLGVVRSRPAGHGHHAPVAAAETTTESVSGATAPELKNKPGRGSSKRARVDSDDL